MSRTAQKLISASGGDTAYKIDQSLYFSRYDDAALSRTPSSAGNLRTWTLSWWMKRCDGASGSITASQIIFGVGDLGASATPHSHNIYFRGDQADRLTFEQWSGSGTTSYGGTTRREFKDTSGWYHFVLIQDSTDGTAGDRFKLYVNGVRETDIPWGTALTSNWDGLINSTTSHFIGGSDPDGDNRHSAMYLAEMHFIDGTAKAVGDFGETDSDTNQWIPKEYTGGSYGTNGFYLKFESGAIGTDSSGEGNNWTTSNLANSDIMLDTPTNNFNTLNSLNKGSYVDLVQGNLTCKGNTDADAGWAHSTMAMTSGKWYAESRIDTVSNWGPTAISISDIVSSGPNNSTSAYYANYASGARTGGASEEYGSTFTEQSGMDTGTTLSAGAIISCAVDMDNKKLFFAINGTYLGSGNPATGANPTFTWSIDTELVYSCQNAFDSPSQNTYNFGQNGTFCGGTTAGGNADGNGYGNFKYSVPSGFLALCTKNLPEPAVKKPSEHFNTVLYTGSDDDSVSQSVTGVGFEPDLVIIKRRDATASPAWWDQVRGEHKGLNSDGNDEEKTDTYGLETFDSDGFTVRESDTAQGKTNTGTLVAWCWKAGGGSGSSNTTGTIDTTSTSVNTTAGISIGTYTGEGGVKTIGHGLGKVPAVYMTKCRSNAIDWCVYHKNAASSPEDGSLSLNDTDDFDDNDNRWNDTAPTSTVFTIYSSNEVNDDDKTYVYYAFAEIVGFSKFGSYSGNGSTSGPYIYTGFRPAWIMIKRVDTDLYNWAIVDSTRDRTNDHSKLILYANATSAEATDNILENLSNGFLLNSTAAMVNNSSGTYVYMAFAEFPFKYANAR